MQQNLPQSYTPSQSELENTSKLNISTQSVSYHLQHSHSHSHSHSFSETHQKKSTNKDKSQMDKQNETAKIKNAQVAGGCRQNNGYNVRVHFFNVPRKWTIRWWYNRTQNSCEVLHFPFARVVTLILFFFVFRFFKSLRKSSRVVFFYSHIFTSKLLDKPWSQVSSLLPPGSCLQFLGRTGFSIPTARRFFIEYYRVLLTHALAFSASQVVRKKKSPRIHTSIHSGGFEPTKLTLCQARG